ncbi:hypothetical protein FV139_00305 [Parahaliea maris]|uniref:Trypsin-like serine protease n=1 Tax=Parahaliea maris TaxID=2716870 RepID=A0A5C9A7A9_9GAMM|nr:Ig-like domain-containing protein [Parahaliea maris]TXS95989.1 hypothetical protein FV139_00305 [Parahaliea maris]
MLDPRGLAYLKGANGRLRPYGHEVAAAPAPAKGKPPGDDAVPPSVSDMSPASGATIGSQATFSATVTDASGIKTVSFVINLPSGQSQSFSPSASGDVYSLGLSGFSDGDWSWQVQATDGAGKGGNTTLTAPVSFTVDTGGTAPPPSGDIIINSSWAGGGEVQDAAGRIYFQMPEIQRRGRTESITWLSYVCSGTVVNDGVSGRSVILTAAHCVYDDVAKLFARNVLFIPNQAGTDGSGTDTQCGNDPIGCWAPAFGVVDVDWTTATFPDNIPWDYAFYVVDDSDTAAHTAGLYPSSSVLDVAATPMDISFAAPVLDEYTYALGYSYSEDPNFMYCAEAVTTEGSYNDWWLPNCGLSGGASGGPWVQPADSEDESLGTGPVMSVNSWGYTNSPGMAGPQLNGTSASCLFDIAKDSDATPIGTADGEAGIIGC